MSRFQRQSAAATLRRIHAGTDPWVAIGDFLDDWLGADVGERRAMIVEPPSLAGTLEDDRWAAFVAAAVDQLVWESEPRLGPPEWVEEPRYVLSRPWFLLPGWRLRMHQLVDTPAAFKRRRIYGGDRILSRV